MESFLLPFTLFGSLIAFNLVLLCTIIAILISEFSESGGVATTVIALFLGFNFFWGNFEVFTYLTLYNIGGYLFTGFVFSLVRTYFKGKELIKDHNEKANFELKEHVFRWWLLFPFSITTWVFGRLLKDLFNWTYVKVEGIYVGIFNAS